MAGNFAVTAFLCLTVAVCLFLNGFLIFNFIRRKRMRTTATAPSSILYVQLAVIDIIGALLWTIHTALSASAGKWSLSDSFCKQQVYIRVFCHMVNVHTLMIFMFERFLRIFKPSKHQEIFFDVVVLLLLGGVYLFDGVLASFPLWGWGEAKYFEKEYQCAIGFEETPSYYDFSISMTIGIPSGIILIGYAAILVRIFFLKRNRGHSRIIVLEENYEVEGDSYSDRLKKLYESFQDTGNKSTKKPKIQADKKLEDTGYPDDGAFDSSEEETEDAQEVKGSKTEKKKKSRKLPPKKCYYLGKNDMGLTHMSAIISAIYMVLWLPYYIRFYQDTYQFYETSPSDGFILAAVCMTHLGCAYKVPLYLFSDVVRGAFRKTLGMGQNEKGDTKGTKRDVHRETI